LQVVELAQPPAQDEQRDARDDGDQQVAQRG
jgi:hypothetical protein